MSSKTGNIFLSGQDMKPHAMIFKRIFELSPIQKKYVRPSHGYGGHIGFFGPWGVGGRAEFLGTSKIQRGQCPRPFK